MVMFLLTLCVEVSQSQGGFEVQSSQFMWLLLGAYLKSRNLNIRYHPTSCQKMSDGINSTKPKSIRHFLAPSIHSNVPCQMQTPRFYRQIAQIFHNRLWRDVFLDLLTKVAKYFRFGWIWHLSSFKITSTCIILNFTFAGCLIWTSSGFFSFDFSATLPSQLFHLSCFAHPRTPRCRKSEIEVSPAPEHWSIFQPCNFQLLRVGGGKFLICLDIAKLPKRNESLKLQKITNS